MSRFLTQEWLDDSRRASDILREWPALSIRLQSVVTGGPGANIESYWVFEDGKMTEAQLGRLEDPEVTMTVVHDEAAKILKGEADPSALILRGTVKTTGNMAKVMALLPILNSTEFKQFLTDVADVTEF
jgi:hypothetical protein